MLLINVAFFCCTVPGYPGGLLAVLVGVPFIFFIFYILFFIFFYFFFIFIFFCFKCCLTEIK